MPRVTCIKCGRRGNLTTKKTKTSGKTYEYYYVQHYIKETAKIEWCYLGLFKKLPEEYKELVKSTVHNYTQNHTQNKVESNNLKSELKSVTRSEIQRAGSLARIGHKPPKLVVAGSNPVPPAI